MKGISLTQTLALSAATVVIAFIISLIFWNPLRVEGSAIQGNDYVATSTAANNVYGATLTASSLIKRGPGSVAQVTITGANTAVWNLYNATTSNVNLRTGQKATSTILIASFPTNATAETYTLDIAFTDGLYLDVISGAMPTSTISYR